MRYTFGQTPTEIAAVKSGTPTAAAEIINETKKGFSKLLLLALALGAGWYIYNRVA